MRRLIHIPIVHSAVELGTLATAIRQQYQHKAGRNTWEQREANLDAWWGCLREELRTQAIDWTATRLYQDGLPICGRESEIAHDLAAQGSRNHQILVELMGRGATLMGTESPELLVREYRRSQALAQAVNQRLPLSQLRTFEHEGKTLLQERDTFIAHRIDSTLQEGETGILFLGMLHLIESWLDGRFDVLQKLPGVGFKPGDAQRFDAKHRDTRHFSLKHSKDRRSHGD